MSKNKYDFQLPYKYSIIGIQTNRNVKKWLNDKTNEVLDDGKSHHILLGGSDFKTVADFLFQSIEKTARARNPEWKIFIEEN